MENNFRLPLRTDLPDGAVFQNPTDTLNAILDVAAEIGKVHPSECNIMDAFPLGIAYGSLKQFVETIQKRRDEKNG